MKAATLADQQRIIRDLSAPYMCLQKPAWTEFRKPFARKPNDEDEWPDCLECDGAGEHDNGEPCFACAPGIVQGRRAFDPAEVILTVWRQSHSVELLVNTQTWQKFFTVDYSADNRPPKVGELSELEKQEALAALTR